MIDLDGFRFLPLLILEFSNFDQQGYFGSHTELAALTDQVTNTSHIANLLHYLGLDHAA